MNTRFLLAACALAIFTAAPSQAAPKSKAKAGSAVPSAQLERLLSPCLEAILAPLQKGPKMPRVQVETLRSTFAGGQVKAATYGQQQVYQNAMNVCTALTTAMDERAKAKSDAAASAKLPSVTNGSGITKSSSAGGNTQAIRKKQQDERKYTDKLAHQQSAFIESGAYKAWTDKAAHLRQNVMALYTRQIQLEALEERSAPPAYDSASASASADRPKKSKSPAGKPTPSPATPAPPAAPAVAKTNPAPAPAPEMAKTDPAKEIPYLGKWHARAGKQDYLISEDHTALRLGGGDVKGSWSLTAKGVFVVSMDDGVGGIWHLKLSEDGKYMHGTNNNARWDRVEPAAAGAPATPAAVPTPAAATKPADKGDAAKEAAYLGNWASANGAASYIIKEDHTAIKMDAGGEKVNGTWAIEADGDFHVKWKDHFFIKGKLSADGQTIKSTRSSFRMVRKP
jgi:hypothetical protein